MKVIAGGKYGGPHWHKKFVCRECEAVLQVEECDLVTVNTAMAYGGETWEPMIHFVCPECEARNDVTYSIPHAIQERLFEALWDKQHG